MSDKNYQYIVDALDVLANGSSKKTNGKITAVNLSIEAGVSKATLYRYFDENPTLKDEFYTLRRNGIRLSDSTPETLQQAYEQQKIIIKSLRSDLTNLRISSKNEDELKSNQILLLWTANENLKSLLSAAIKKSNNTTNVVSLTKNT